MAAREGGFAVVWFAATLLFLLGVAALAVDASSLYQRARSQQRATDLACLAGVVELPEDPAQAVAKAATYLPANHDGLSSIDPADPTSGTRGSGVARWDLGDRVVEIETPYGGHDTKLRVTLSVREPTEFGAVLGVASVSVAEQAICEVGSALGAGLAQPFGVVAPFSGGLINFGKNECTLNGDSSSKCSGLAIPRHDDPPGSSSGVRTAKNFIANMISGLSWDILYDASQDVLCATVQPGPPEPCNRVATVSGDEPSKLYQGLISGNGQYLPESEIGYLERDDGGPRLTHGTDEFDGHELGEVAECADPSDPSRSGSEYCPTAADTLTWDATTVHERVTVTKVSGCDCPRFARVLVVESFPLANCSSQVFDPDDPDKVDKCSAKVVDWEWVYLVRPFYDGTNGPTGFEDVSDFENEGNGQTLRTVAAVVLDFAPGAFEDSGCFAEYDADHPKVISLVGA